MMLVWCTCREGTQEALAENTHREGGTQVMLAGGTHWERRVLAENTHWKEGTLAAVGTHWEVLAREMQRVVGGCTQGW